MTWPQHSDPKKNNRRARAPYNFVPLPEDVIEIEEDPPAHDCYDSSLHTGYLECTLKTETPLYIRGPLELDEFEAQETDAEQEQEKPYPKQIKNKPEFFYTDPATKKPMVPGSSLRGMLRTLIEIIGYGKMEWVTQQCLIYRAVGDTSSLGDLYRNDMLPRRSSSLLDYPSLNLRGGYLERQGSQWVIRPTQQGTLGETFVHIEYDAAGCGQHNPANPYTPADVIDIYVKPPTSWTTRPIGKTSLSLRLAYIGDPADVLKASSSSSPPAGFVKATLVRSGHMGGRAAKHMHCAIYEPDSNANPLPIPQELWALYENDRDLTRGFHTRPLRQPGDPLFYLVDNSGQLVFFGPTMMFRLPYPNSPIDYVPRKLRRDSQIDLTEALFGFTPDHPQGGYSGRTFFTDARLESNQKSDWQEREAITPNILASPKPTTFQHYLVQDHQQGHDPDDKRQLAHYGTPTPDESVIRGHKLYWHKGDVSEADFTDPDADPNSTQHTLMKPVGKDTHFRFRIYFENLKQHELGALLWGLTLPGPDGPYRHKLGMAKPLGLGSVHIEEVDLQLSNRQERYQRLFDQTDGNWNWHLPTRNNQDAPSQDDLIRAFEEFVLNRLGEDPDQRLSELPRIRALLTMLKWPGPDLRQTEYMEIKLGEFRERKVLPTPQGVMDPQSASRTTRRRRTTATKGKKKKEEAQPSGEQLLDQLERDEDEGEEVREKVQPGDKVKAEIIAKKGDQIKVRMIGAHNEVLTFTKPYFPQPVGAILKLRVRKLDEKGRITEVTP